MLKFSTSVIRYILSRIKIINPTNVSKGEMLQEIRKELNEELEEIKKGSE